MEPATNGAGDALSRMPGLHALRAALKVGELLDPERTSLAALRNAYSRVPSGGLFEMRDLVRGEEVLRACKLVYEEDGHLLRSDNRIATLLTLDDEMGTSTLLGVYLDQVPPPWLTAAASGDEFEEHLIPGEELLKLERILVDPDAREAFLLAHGQRVDPAARTALGALGEVAVLDTYRGALTDAGQAARVEEVVRVGEIDDRLGYDVVGPVLSGGKNRMEVKTTKSTASVIRIVLSRNEARYGLADPAWSLVVCHALDDERAEVVGHCKAGALEPHLPADRTTRGRWSSVEIMIEFDELKPGLPPIS